MLVLARTEAEEAQEARNRFALAVSHELRTPMNAIIGMTHLCLKSELTAKQRDHLKKIDRSAHSLLGIINDILDFSKIEAGKLDMETVDFDLAQVLDTLANVVSVKSGEKGLELIVDLDPEIPPGLKGDPLRLNQILINLANNAVKFTGENGHVRVRAQASSRRRDTIEIAVEDDGAGNGGDRRPRDDEDGGDGGGNGQARIMIGNRGQLVI